MAVRHVMVVGAGQMGSGIAQVAAQAGCRVWLKDINEELVEKGLARIRSFLERGVQRGKVTAEEKDAALGRITGTVGHEAAADCDIVIEAVVEDLEVKNRVFAELDEVCPERTIFATNTSSLPITQLAAATGRPDRFIGMHFMNPVPLMKLVEIIRGLATSDATYETVRELAVTMGKEPVTVQDSPGFVSNRILIPMINEAVYCLQEGLATPEDIDTVMRLGMNHPMGPLALADLIGLDTVLYIADVLYREFQDSKYRACPLLRKMVRAGYLGRKTGRGFYTYES
ncbi:MAG TPA: 3-hydroxybutyryl-CoA dehydrogenase [Clostridiales bacterium]|nr:3-hydroxybutyryl-CoA dehydrogenase [Clostridiales bacterium]